MAAAAITRTAVTLGDVPVLRFIRQSRRLGFSTQQIAGIEEKLRKMVEMTQALERLVAAYPQFAPDGLDEPSADTATQAESASSGLPAFSHSAERVGHRGCGTPPSPI